MQVLRGFLAIGVYLILEVGQLLLQLAFAIVGNLTRYHVAPHNDKTPLGVPLEREELGEVSLNEKSPIRDVYDAVADPTRRKLLQLLAGAEELPLYEITPHFEMGRTAVSKHLTILKEAGLVTDRKVGRETRYRLQAAPLREIQDWLAFYRKFWIDNAARLQQLLQDTLDEDET